MPVITFDVHAVAAESGDAVDTQRLKPWKSLHFSGLESGTFSVATLRVQGSNDNTNWIAIGSDVTASSIVNLVEPLAFMRIYTVAYTSGTPKCVMSAHDVSGS